MYKYRHPLVISVCLTLGLSYPVMAQTQVNAAAVNGVLNPVYFSGADIGAKVNAAWSSGIGTTVRIPAGTYSFSTTINHPGSGFTLQCDAGAVLNYVGSGDAVVIPGTANAPTAASGIDGEGGCLINGTSAGRSAIHLQPANHIYIRNMRLTGFSSGYGIYNTGANSVGISGNNIRNNKTGIYLTGVANSNGGFAANSVRIYDNEIVNNAQWGLDSENSHCACTQNIGNQIMGNVFEGNGNGVELNWDIGATVEGNYFENSGVNLGLGNGLDNVFAMNVLHNHFTDGTANPEGISLGYGIGFDLEDNDEVGASESQCFINKTYGPNGSDNGIRGVGTNYLLSAPPSHEICNHSTPGN
jgi:hypothetical protein